MAEESNHFIVYDSSGQEFGQNLAGQFSAPRGIDLDPLVWGSVHGWAGLGRVPSGVKTLAGQSCKAGFNWGAWLLSLSPL